MPKHGLAWVLSLKEDDWYAMGETEQSAVRDEIKREAEKYGLLIAVLRLEPDPIFPGPSGKTTPYVAWQEDLQQTQKFVMRKATSHVLYVRTHMLNLIPEEQVKVRTALLGLNLTDEVTVVNLNGITIAHGTVHSLSQESKRGA